MSQPVAKVVDLTDPTLTSLRGTSLEDARARVARGDAEGVAALDGSYALVGVDGIAVRLARSMDRPLRYFLAKEAAGPVLVVADRIDAIQRWLAEHGHADQFHPSYTRMVPAHHLATVRLVGCPDPEPSYVRTFTPERNALPGDLDTIGRLYVSALADEIAGWLERVPAKAPLGVCFSGGIDSGAVFLVTHHVLRKLGMSPARLKAFTLTLGDGPDLAQARAFLDACDMGFFLEPIEADAGVAGSLRGGPRHRGLQAARRRVRDDGDRAPAAASARATRTGRTSSTATAATRTSRTTRSRRTPS